MGFILRSDKKMEAVLHLLMIADANLLMSIEVQDKKPNGPMQLIPVPSGLLARRLLSRLWCQKQAGIPDRGRSLKI